ncbi:Uncharacterized conserved protein, DUF4415 family [Devosia lucknowensis]|uniref:Uncharacterized conserved protein, DUF4415 family n=1 Tax=Devosia lucknowensis TaxID=1096929 RepID=A0A1Y6FQM1_9HYPH|nr:BrnA antitoxin family protein [Devosia lucknowensis]SMQ75781.1 Uncharacterized conserved protein, DUF4415 family [Devosia lucknowensis]
MTEENIKRYTLAELREMRDRGDYFYDPNAPEGPDLPDSFWENAALFDTDQKTSVHLKLDAEVFFFFKSQGKGHITRMQDVLKAYVKAQKAKQSAAPAPQEKPARKTG